MELPDIVSVRKFREFNVRQKEELYETLLNLAEVVEEIPKKSLRKTLDVTLAVVHYKGEQVAKLQEQLDEKSLERNEDDSHNERLLAENEKLKRMLEKLEDEKVELKEKAKELTNEIFQLQKRLQDATNLAEASDKDSSDPLSELDKQEELLRNISTKNKHIKRLLREIESLQNQNIEQSKKIIDSEKELQQAKTELLQLSADITLVDSERKALKDTVNELNIEIARLEGNITYLEEEREKNEKHIKEFVEKLESKAKSWKHRLDQKDKEIKKLRARMEKEGCSFSLTETIAKTDATDIDDDNDDDDTMHETTKMLHAIETRDKLIEQLEAKIKSMAEEMITSTELMNKLSSQKEEAEAQNPKMQRTCCKLLEESLQAANARCHELSEMLERSEEDNVLKSKQAMQAITALDSYQRGEDGLVKALRKCSTLEQKVLSRDKQIRALVMELNSMHEIAYENGVLRKRLGIPDDVVISAKNLAAKERNKDKIIDRLTLKLRASEEMRLQLKLEKSDLRKELIQLQAHPDKPDEIQEVSDSIKTTSEIGEVPDSIRAARDTDTCVHCDAKSIVQLQQLPTEINRPSTELQMKYKEVLQENETLRLGMLEILEKIREYDASSDHITIDTGILNRLLQALQLRSLSPNTPKRLQSELSLLKQREESLRELMKKTIPTQANDSDDLASVESIREDGELRNNDEDVLQIPNFIDSSTRPTTPNKSINQSDIPVINEESPRQPTTDDARELKLQIYELQIYRKHYEELKIHMAASDTELTRNCADLVEKVTSLELELTKQTSSYEYMREDFDKILTANKQNELQHIHVVAELQSKLNEKDQSIKKYELEYEQYKKGNYYSADEYRALVQGRAEIEAQLAYLVEQVLTGKLSPELKIPDICTDFGIIKDNLQLDYITATEYEEQRVQLNTANEKHSELNRKIMQLEGLLEIAQNQIQSQQKLLNDVTDNHINLRHFVADLQSTTEEKLLLAKIQRDFDNAKSEVIVLKTERDELKQKYENIQINLNAQEQMMARLNKNFQIDTANKNTKIKFLQKSLYALKEKYIKFTPLIFLTNFIFAHTKFIKMSSKSSENDKHKELVSNLDDIITSKVKECEENANESETLIKLIKIETQCRLLEETVSSLQKRNNELQLEMSNLRIRSANESEHWHTIEALFNQDDSRSSTFCKKVEGKEEEEEKSAAHINVHLIDAATNTERPVPAERKLTAIAVTSNEDKSIIKLVDKCISPIGSPSKPVKKPVCEIAIQTNITNEKDTNIVKTKEKEVQTAKQQIEQTDREMQNETIDAIVQTSSEHVKIQAIQTIETQVIDTKQYEKDNDEKIVEVKGNEQILRQTQEELNVAYKRIEDLQIRLKPTKVETRNALTYTDNTTSIQQDLNQQTGIIEKTIISFHTLLSEKDKSISKYQDLLQSEREQSHTNIGKLNGEIEGLKNTITNLNFNIKTKDMEILELKTKLEVVSVRRNSNEKLDLATTDGVGICGDDNGDNSLNELTDEKIEEMFQQDASPVSTASAAMVPRVTVTTSDTDNEEKHDTEALKEIPSLQKQIKELKDKGTYWENTLKVKEDEITLLREKVNIYQERAKSIEGTTNPEIEQLRVLLEDKDKHINELMDTLSNFHDDQQRYINDSSNYSADQISKLSTDLTRTAATNKIYQTQVEALRRQLASLTQREKQTREQNQSLRNQLIKRPVVSIKTELNARVKTENLQKRIQHLELELEEARALIHRQQILIDAKRARSANEVGLWEKQKRWQQSAEKFKTKLEETECTLEKTRALLQSARNTITRFEKDKQILEMKLGRVTHSGSSSATMNIKCCRTPSCPNLHQAGGKYTPSESPETYTGASSECSSPAHSAPCGGRAHLHGPNHYYSSKASHDANSHPHADLIETLKARIDMQQRKIIAMELEGKGSNTLTTEMEKLQERYSAIEAQNIRLESKNLQLHLDNDLLRQGDATDRLQKRIKHLEDYIIALKEEIAHKEARRELCKCTGIKLNTQQGQPAEQTILALRAIVEKLRAENKYLKDGKRSSDSKNTVESSTELNRLQQMYAESLDKISVLQKDLSLKEKCKNCRCRERADTSINEEITFIKEQLLKKTQLLQKAKVLLTRAAAKEKILKEQLSLWKRKCSELQNVPVIDEISE